MHRAPRAERPARLDAGFSLIELLVVVAIVGILASIVVPAFQGLVQSVQEASTRSDLASSRTAITAWQLDNNGLLPTEAGFDPGPTGTNLTAYGWSRGDSTAGYGYSTGTAVKPTTFCLQMMSTDQVVYRVSTNKAIVAGTCSALGRTNY